MTLPLEVPSDVMEALDTLTNLCFAHNIELGAALVLSVSDEEDQWFIRFTWDNPVAFFEEVLKKINEEIAEMGLPDPIPTVKH